MKGIHILKVYYLCSTLLLALAPLAHAAAPPNIVFFFTDDQTTSTIGCYGNDIIQTPNIDKLAADGVRFTNAFVSHPICWVSRTTIMTGLTARGFSTPEEPDRARLDTVETLYTDILRAHGYRTGFFGKWDTHMPKEFTRENHFDEFEAIGRNPYYKKQPDGSLRHETELIVDRGIEFIQNQPKDTPFALNLWFNACHAEDNDRRPGIGHFPWPRTTDGMYEDLTMADPRLCDPAIFEAQPDFLKTTINRERYFWRWNTPMKYQTNMRAYYRMASGIDQNIGRFMEALQAAGLAENTIVVYSADNGYHMANRGFAGKWTHYEESLRVPMIVMDPRLPAAQRGQVSNAMALNLDLPATFLDWAGAEVPARYQGRSLAPVVHGGTPADWRKETFHEHVAVRTRIPSYEGVRDERYKYVRYFSHDNYEFLHDLQKDPDELVNLAGDLAYADTLADMRARTDAQVAQLGGPVAPLKQPFTASTVPHPEASAAVTVKPGPDGFVNLFNGESLFGWAGDDALWSVEDGVLTGKTDGTLEVNSFLTWTGSTIRNFDLRLNVKITAGGNSGIQYRSASRPEIGLYVISGYQCDIVADKAEYNGMLYEERGRGILSQTGQTTVVGADGKPQVKESTPAPEFAPGEWHEYRILMEGNHAQHWIDGQKTTNVIDLDETGRALEGVLAFQVHVGDPMTVQFKDIKIKHLPDEMTLTEE